MAEFREITPTELQSLRDAGSATILDIREPWETEICRFDDALFIPMSSLPGRVQEVPDDRPVAVICHSGVRSYMVGEWLARQGFDAMSLAGGIDRWAREVDAAMKRY